MSRLGLGGALDSPGNRYVAAAAIALAAGVRAESPIIPHTSEGQTAFPAIKPMQALHFRCRLLMAHCPFATHAHFSISSVFPTIVTANA
jgi:hypothetical protein